MKEVKKSWMAVVMGVILVGTLVGVVWARPNDRPEAQDITRKITVPAGFFHAAIDGIDWVNLGPYIKMTSGPGIFTAPVVFPCLPSVTVERLTLYVEDNNSSWNACAALERTRPQQGDQAQMAHVCSNGTTTGVQPFTDGSISPDVVWPSHGVYAWINIDGTSIYVHAVRIEYHRNL